MKAMIFTAGIGSRLQPEPGEIPRALMPVNGEPLLGMLIRRLADSGFNEIIVNVHHFASRISEFINRKIFEGLRIEISDETDLRLDTGGGLKKVAWFFNDNQPFLIYHIEILSDINLSGLYEDHIRSRALATLVVRKRQASRFLLFNRYMELCGWENIETKERSIVRPCPENLQPFAFSRIQVVSPSIFSLIIEKGTLSLVELYLRLAGAHPVRGYSDNESIWMDLARKEGLLEAEKLFLKN